MAFLVGSLCYEDIPKDAWTVGKNGKHYLSVVIGNRRAGIDQWGYDHYMRVGTSVEDKDAGKPAAYIGSLKDKSNVTYGGGGSTPQQQWNQADAPQQPATNYQPTSVTQQSTATTGSSPDYNPPF